MRQRSTTLACIGLVQFCCAPKDRPLAALQEPGEQRPGTVTANASSSVPSEETPELDPDFPVPVSEWSDVATPADCNLQVAVHPEHVWSGFVFETVAPGVEWTGALPGPSKSLFNFGLELGNGRDDALLSAGLNWPGRVRNLVVSVDLRTGAVVSVASTRNEKCALLALSPRLSVTLADTDTQFGWLAPSGAIVWQPPSGTSPSDGFDTGERWGLTLGLASIRVTSNPPGTTLHDVYTSDRYVRTPVGKDGILFWTEMGTIDGRVMALDPDDRVHELVVPESYLPVEVAVDGDTLGWIGVDGPLALSGAYERVVVYECQWSSFKDTCAPKQVAELPFNNGIGDMEVTDRWIAVPGCTDYVCGTIVVDRVDKSLHKLRATAGLAFVDAIGIVDDQLYARGYTQDAIGTGFFERLLRFDLARISEFSEVL